MTDFSVIDQEQLERIENTHGGFFYQHLYAVGCLLSALGSKVASIHPERDEDIELQLDDRRVYVQVKHYSNDLIPSHIGGALARFDEIRKAHISGERPGNADFYIVSSANLGPTLAKQAVDAAWPVDVHILWPSGGVQKPDFLPPAWPTIQNALEWCIGVSNTLPYAKLSGFSLVFKLAALVQCASAGEDPYPDHSFSTTELHELFEQIVIQLQRVPEVPDHYLPLISEPELTQDPKPQLIVGHSGSGKTAWASEAIRHCPLPATYFDARGIPHTSLAADLSRELAARFLLGDGQGLGSVLVPGRSGIDALRAVDIELGKRLGIIVVILDNTQQLPSADITAVVEATSCVKFVMLSQQSPTVREIEIALDIEATRLTGWSADTVAAYCGMEGCPVDTATSESIIALSAGMPLHVRQMVKLAKNTSSGDIRKLCGDIASGNTQCRYFARHACIKIGR